MRILFLNLYSGKIERGAESFSHELASQLEKQGHQVTFLKGNTTHLPSDSFSGTLLAKIRKRLFIDQAGLEVLIFSLRQIHHIVSHQYQVIIPLNGFWQLLILKLIQPFKRYKIIVTGHSGPGWDERWNLYLHPNLFIASTKPTLRWAQTICPWTQSVLIPYGIDPYQFLNSSKARVSLPRLPRPWILCPSALVPYKRVELAIKAVSKLSKGSLIVLGKGPEESNLIKLANKLLPNRFSLFSVPHSNISTYYQACDLVTLPSNPQENSPIVFLEALAANKLVVTTDAPRTRWALGKSGLFINPEDIDTYAAALKKAISFKPNTKTDLKKFLWTDVIKQYQYHLHHVTNSN